MSEKDATPADIEALIAEFEKTQARARRAGRLDIVEGAQRNIDNLRESLRKFVAAQQRLVEAHQELARAREASAAEPTPPG